ncbi:MAG: hypothetical protein BM556_00295 [Bacteriovorax sp. MedPE-SWde]|nr:MAG: hypothetical protein BM556_00295 [Bacteriovorax sp. MedPE-SWde]
MRNLLVGMFMLLTAVSANAVNLAFKFDVTSSGNSMYACNAGLKHTNPAGRVCYNRETLNSCDPTSVCTDGQDCNCVCTGGGLGDDYVSHAGEYRLDFFTASHANWTDNGVAPSNIQNVKYTASKNSFRTLFSDSSKFGKQLTSLSFALGSERYGAEYFVDVCFRATQIDYPTSFNNSDYLNWAIMGGVTVTDISTQLAGGTFDINAVNNNNVYSSQSYQDLSGLQVRASLYCKAKGKNAPVKNYTTQWTNFNDGQLKRLINDSTREDLKGCYFRYSFRESTVAGINSVRKWKKQKAQICTYSSVNEPLEE